jgi:aspartyl-tRNA(Asn)/glutamyl-tRNA(Gln) amidotransferase subunit C
VMMQIDEALVRKVAVLGSIALSDEEVQQYQDELSKVLTFVEQLDNLPLGDVQPTTPEEKVKSPVTATTTADSLNAFRKDVAHMPLGRSTLMQNAPDVEAGAYVVPNIL